MATKLGINQLRLAKAILRHQDIPELMPPSHIEMSRDGWQRLLMHPDIKSGPNTPARAATLLGFSVKIDPSVPDDEIHMVSGGKVTARFKIPLESNEV